MQCTAMLGASSASIALLAVAEMVNLVRQISPLLVILNETYYFYRKCVVRQSWTDTELKPSTLMHRAMFCLAGRRTLMRLMNTLKKKQLVQTSWTRLLGTLRTSPGKNTQLCDRISELTPRVQSSVWQVWCLG